MDRNSWNQLNKRQEIIQRIISFQSEKADDLSFSNRSKTKRTNRIRDLKYLALKPERSSYRENHDKTCKEQPSMIEKIDDNMLPLKPLNLAVLNGKIETVLELLYSGANPEEKDGYYGNTGMHWAIKADNVQVLDLYRKRGFDLSGTNNFGWAPIHVAAEGSRCKSLLWLLNNGAEVDAKDPLNQTPLFKAAYKGRVIAAKILLSYGATLDFKDMKSHTPLMVAVMGGHIEMVKLLFELGADSRQVDGWGRNLLHFTKTLPLMEWLIERNLDINGKDDWGRTPLHDTVQASNLEIASFLLKKGADLEAQDRNGCTPLYEAAKTGRAEMVRLFLENGGDPECIAKDGSTPLDVAFDDIIKNMLMLKKGSGRNSRK